MTRVRTSRLARAGRKRCRRPHGWAPVPPHTKFYLMTESEKEYLLQFPECDPRGILRRRLIGRRSICGLARILHVSRARVSYLQSQALRLIERRSKCFFGFLSEVPLDSIPKRFCSYCGSELAVPRPDRSRQLPALDDEGLPRPANARRLRQFD